MPTHYGISRPYPSRYSGTTSLLMMHATRDGGRHGCKSCVVVVSKYVLSPVASAQITPFRVHIDAV